MKSNKTLGDDMEIFFSPPHSGYGMKWKWNGSARKGRACSSPPLYCLFDTQYSGLT